MPVAIVQTVKTLFAALNVVGGIQMLSSLPGWLRTLLALALLGLVVTFGSNLVAKVF